MSQNPALAKLRQLNEAKKAEATQDKKVTNQVQEDLEVTDEVFVVADAETGEILSDIITDKEEAEATAEEIAQEKGVDVVTESLTRSRVKKATKKVSESKTRKAPARKRIALNLK